MPTRSILAGLAMQAIIVAVLSALLGGVLSVLLGPLFPMRVDIPHIASHIASGRRGYHRSTG